MSRKPISQKPLKLNKRALRRLQDDELSRVDGGGGETKKCDFTIACLTYGCPIKTNR